jgi:ABC-2 type transport system permease protein
VDFGQIAVLSATLSLGQLFMLGIGMLLSMFVTRTRAVMSASIGVVLGLYVLSMLVNIWDGIKALKYITPFQYFDSRAILRGGIEPLYIILAIGVAAVCAAASLAIYNRRDLKC